ncbi:hypothetical protein [Streptomyces kanamyceticus]|uniref:hypothetical protein n=1 Tax=Streptomyces kanamyceticus TaxID=1967 RepID=UPI000A6DF02F|nr:hypothetical protein [Streptomyces kanamyceticus]
MTAKKTTPHKPHPPVCPDCKGAGEITETVRVGIRKGRATDDQQSALCPKCWGTGEATD